MAPYVMPLAPARLCGSCGRRVTGAHDCRSRRDTRRPSAAARGYGRSWQAARADFLAAHPLCMCERHQGREDAPAATVVDHIVPHQGDQRLFWDPKNWRALAKACHDRKTASQDGGFGNAMQARAGQLRAAHARRPA